MRIFLRNTETTSPPVRFQYQSPVTSHQSPVTGHRYTIPDWLEAPVQSSPGRSAYGEAPVRSWSNRCLWWPRYRPSHRPSHRPRHRPSRRLRATCQGYTRPLVATLPGPGATRHTVRRCFGDAYRSLVTWPASTETSRGRYRYRQ